MNLKNEIVNINRSSSEIKYDDDKNMWSADIIFDVYQKSIYLYGTTRTLTDVERSNIITEILNKFFFNYINKINLKDYLYFEDNVYLCKLKNRGLEKKEELKQQGTSYSILGETIMELPKHPLENSIISDIRNIYLYLKLAVEEGIQKNSMVFDSIPFEFEGDSHRYKRMLKILEELIPEFEDYLTKYLCGQVNISISKGKLRNKKAVVFIKIKEAK